MRLAEAHGKGLSLRFGLLALRARPRGYLDSSADFGGPEGLLLVDVQCFSAGCCDLGGNKKIALPLKPDLNFHTHFKAVLEWAFWLQKFQGSLAHLGFHLAAFFEGSGRLLGQRGLQRNPECPKVPSKRL